MLCCKGLAGCLAVVAEDQTEGTERRVYIYAEERDVSRAFSFRTISAKSTLQLATGSPSLGAIMTVS